MKTLVLCLFASKLFSLGPDDKLETDRKGAILRSPEIEVSDQYSGVPCAPIIHHYTNFQKPHFLLALQGKMTASLLEGDPKMLETMKSVGVTLDDPFLLMVQGFSGVINPQGTGLVPKPPQPLLARPMYYYSQNRSYSHPSVYNESITVASKLYDPFGKKVVLPTGAIGQYGVSIHNASQKKELVSSSGNMGLPSLKYEQSACLFGFYKGKSRSVSGTPKVRPELDTRGVSVLHVILAEKDRETLTDALGSCLTPKDILGVLELGLIDSKINTLLYETLLQILDTKN